MTSLPDQSAVKVWRVHRWENERGGYFELASNELAADQIPLPPGAEGYRFVSSTPMVPELEAAALNDVARAARELDVLFAGNVDEWQLDGSPVSEEAAAALLSLHDYLNDLARARGQL